MAKINIKLGAPQTKDGTDIELTPRRTGGAGRYEIIEPGFYSVIVKELQTLSEKEAVYTNRNKTETYLKVRPSFQVVNDAQTLINRQDFTVGFYSADEGLYTNDPTRSPIWGGVNGARSLLTALGLFADLGDGNYHLELDTDNVFNRVVRARIGIAGYVRNNYGVTDLVRTPFEFNNEMVMLKNEIAGVSEWTLADLQELVPAFNAKHGLGDDGLKTKNMIMDFYGVTDWDAETNGWFVVNDQVFLSENDYNKFCEGLLEGVDSEEAAW